MLARLRLGRFVIPVLVAAALAGCSQGGSGSHLSPGVPGAPRGVRDFTPQNQCITLRAADPAGGSPAQIVCFLQPNASITLDNLSMHPIPGAGDCGTAVWTAALTSQATPGLSVTVSPTTTGGARTSCDRTDTVSMTVTTDGTLPNDFPDGQEHYDIKGTFCRWFDNTCEPGWVEIAARVDFVPSIHILDQLLNKHVENTSVTAVAGQQQILQIKSPNTADLSDCHWVMPSAFPNDAVDDYVPTDTLSSPAPSAANLNTNSIRLYWIKPETQMSIQANCLIAGGPTRLTANATYTIKAPTSSVTATYGPTGADLSYHLLNQGHCPPSAVTTPWLHYGDPCSPAVPGILSQYTVTSDADEAGTTVMFQLIDDSRTRTTTGGITSNSSSNGSCVDNQMQYGTPVVLAASGTAVFSADDSPAGGLDGYTSLRITDNFDDYFMYKPNDDSLGHSIWIALDRLQWSWDAQTTLTNGAWATPTILAQLQPANGTAYTDLPRWSCKFQNSAKHRTMM